MIFTITAVALSGLINLNPMTVLNNKEQNQGTAVSTVSIATDTTEGISDSAEPEDDRASRLDAYFSKWDMPLAGYGAKFISEADKYGIDWKLMPAIAVQESSGGKYMKNNNPFGWGSCEIKFASFNEAIEELAANLGGTDPETARYYKDASVDKILWHYNGSVNKSYPGKIKYIMTLF